MNSRTSLAAALLMTASAAMAQTRNPSNSGGILPGGNSPSFCLPSDTACQNSFMTGPGASDESQTIAAYTLPPGAQWASPDCQHVPCRLADSPGKPDTAGEILGPPLPPGFYDEQDRKALAEARREVGQDGVKDVVDLGGGRLAKMLNDGTVAVCSRSKCDKPVPADSLKDPKIEALVKSNQMTDGSSGGGGIKTTGTGPVKTAPSRPAADNPARDIGAEFAADQGSLTPGFGAASAYGGGEVVAKAGKADRAGAKAGEDGVGKVDGAMVKRDGIFTYLSLQKNAETLKKEEAGVRSNGVFAPPGNIPDANAGGHEFRGTQSRANSQ